MESTNQTSKKKNKRFNIILLLSPFILTFILLLVQSDYGTRISILAYTILTGIIILFLYLLFKLLGKTLGFIALFVLIFGSTLPFHYLIGCSNDLLQVIPKDHFTFEHTIITGQDVLDLIERFNNASYAEQQGMRQDPLWQTLIKNGIIYEKDLNYKKEIQKFFEYFVD
jgi:hypothetical protein